MIKLLLCCLAVTIGAASVAETIPSASDPRAVIAQKFPGARAEDVRQSPLPNVFEVSLGSDTAYVSADGRYLINGDLYEIDSRTNLTETGRADTRRKILSTLDERDMIIFAPAAAKYTITVFTDVECGYCRKLHSEIEQINKLGVRVRYLAYPRAGPGSDDWRKMEAVWCAKDRKTAITQAKAGAEVKSLDCGATPVAKQYALGEKMRVNGTPAVFTDAGNLIGGYLPPQQLLEQLEALDKSTAAKSR